MMGRTHAVSGAAVWLGLCAAAAAAGHHPSLATVVVGGGICAGFALVPDFDHPSSLISRTYGPITQTIAYGVAAVSRWVQLRTRTRLDARARGGHRWLAHTWPFALTVGAPVTFGCWLGGRWGVAVVMFAAATLALRGLLSARERHRSGPWWIAATAATVAVACAWLPDGSWWWAGLPATIGCLTHDLGDALTEQCCPLLWPIPVAGRRWYPVGLPEVLRLSTGSWVEQAVVMPLLAAGAVAAGWTSLIS